MDYGKKDKKPVAGFGDIAGLPGGAFEPSTSDDMALLEKMIGPSVGMFQRLAPVNSSEQDRARRLANEMAARDLERSEIMKLVRGFKGIPKVSFEFMREVSEDPFGVAAKSVMVKTPKSVEELFGIDDDSSSMPTKFEKIIGDM
tara:strand:- start:188 stop:619 length:432 start_codon:yes stop_codon:yes gene_type:complete